MPKTIQELTDLIAEMPGIGPRQARRVVQFLLRARPQYKQALIEKIGTLSDHISQCTMCFRYDEAHEHKKCVTCADGNRSQETLIVVEKDVDIEGIESAGAYRGQYFVLGSLMPLTQTRKTAFAPRTNELSTRIKNTPLNEVILAFATTPEGDFTAREIKKKITAENPNLTVTILGRGLSLGAEIEYADQETLRSALQGRQEEF